MIRATGIDISKWDFPYTPKPVDFVIQRLSYGLMQDERLAELTPLVIQAPVKGAYHYYSSGSPWQTQMDFFLGLEGGKYDFLCLDIEKLFNTDSTTPQTAKITLTMDAASNSWEYRIGYASIELWQANTAP